MAKRLTRNAWLSQSPGDNWQTMFAGTKAGVSGITGTNGNDTLVGTEGPDTFEPLLGSDTVEGLGGDDTLIVDYSSLNYDPFGGASIPVANTTAITSSGGSFSGRVSYAYSGGQANFTGIEHVHASLGRFPNAIFIEGAALASGATLWIDGGSGSDELHLDLSQLAAGVTLSTDANGVMTGSGMTFVSVENCDIILGGGGDNVATGGGADKLTGNGGDDVLNGGGGSDILDGGSGANNLLGGDGGDQIRSTGIDTVDGGEGTDFWKGDYSGATAAISATYDGAAATLSNGTTLVNLERVELITGSGNDVFRVTGATGMIARGGAGQDSLYLTGSGFQGMLSADGPGAVQGYLGSNVLSGIEVLSFTAGAGDDSLIVNASALLAGATISLDVGGGIDALNIDLSPFSAISFVAQANGIVTTNVPVTLLNFEAYKIVAGADNDQLSTAGGDDNLQGRGGDDVIDSGGGNDLLDGGTGTDSLTGGLGDDTYVIDSADDQAIELAGQGNDTVRTTASYTLAFGSEIEGLTADNLTGNAALALTGNEFAQTITGNAGGNTLIGAGGADILIGREGDDTYVLDNSGDRVIEAAQQGNDTVFTSVSYALAEDTHVETLSSQSHTGTNPLDLVGNGFSQTIYGNAGDNLLNGLGAADIMIGLAGNDTYVVDIAQDQVFEGFGGGGDTVFTDISYSLGSNQYIETLSTQTHNATVNLNLVGNQLNNYLYGNFGNNLLNGVDGADTMIGLYGDDTYSIDNAGDLVVELEGQGNDVVFTFVSHTLTNGNEVETLSTVVHTATTAIDLGGNDYANHLIGNYGNNYLNGGGGADVLTGLNGNDTYVIDNAGDQVEEVAGGGSDAVLSFVSYTLAANQEVEVLSTTFHAGTGAIDLTGNNLAQTIIGNNGANVLNGGAGNDTLIGNGGADFFAFTTALGATNVDAVADFNVADDTIRLDDAIFTALGLGTLGADAFVTGAAAGDADDRIVYDSTTGALYYDADGIGIGAMVQFATLSTGLAMTAADFVVV